MRVSTSSELQEQAEKCLLAAQRAVQPEVQRAYLDLMGGLIELAALMARLDQKSELRR
jgi:hypothetical protein